MQITYFLGLIPFVFLISTAVAAPVNNLQARGSFSIADNNYVDLSDIRDILNLKNNANLEDSLDLVHAFNN